MLGDDGRIAISNFDIATMLNGMLGGLLSSSEATTSSLADAMNLTMHDIAYALILFKPEYLGIAINAAAINEIVNFYRRADGKEESDVFTSSTAMAEVMLKLETVHKLNEHGEDETALTTTILAKMNDSFYASVDISDLKVGTGVNASQGAGLTGKTGRLPQDSELENYVVIYDIGNKQLQVEKISLKLQGELTITSNTTNDEGTFANWLGKFVRNTVGKLLESDMSKIGNFNFYLPSILSLILDAEIDLNLAAMLTSAGTINIGGIAYSDMKIDIRFGEPLNSQFLSLYYLGSSKLSGSAGSSANTNRVVNTTGSLFNDAFYLDLTAFGLGRVKLSGLIGLLGGNSGKMEALSSGTAVSTSEA
ncbi:MAG: hypothetical protein ACI4QU_04050, partial [Christensenellales bacterium]